MKVELLSKGQDSVTLVIKGVNEAFVNALRRAVVAEVPVFAIEDVHVYENTSAVWDEYVAHRLGLIPLSAQPGTYDVNSEARFLLEAEGPVTVYSSDLKPVSGDVDVADKRIPIIRLAEGQRVRMECVAKVGTAREHAKWQPGLASFRPIVFVHVKDGKKFKELTGIDPKEVEKENERPEGVSSRVYNLADWVDEKEKGVVDIQKKKDAFIFYAESYGNMAVKDLVSSAVDVLVNKVKEFTAALEGSK